MAWYQEPLTPAERISSPQPQTDAQYDIIMPGFGIEFEHSLKRAWEDHEDKERGRLARYSRFGMTKEEARQATPELVREAYRKLVEDQLADDYTPSPSPSIPPTPRSIEFDDRNITEAHSPNIPLQKDPRENHRHPIVRRNGSSYQYPEPQLTPDSSRPHPIKSVTRMTRMRSRVVIGSKIAKKSIWQTPTHNVTQSRHHMETRSRKLASKGGLG